ncbi:hypothetical protein SLS62_009063 [Diatrype stigma]|uniref:Manganese lipoxygenase n=1 Tax=Diatrype stigma TaxID=117547 RepID=A0AAN9UFZ5_9PEZI
MRSFIPGLLCAWVAVVDGVAVPPSARSLTKRQGQDVFSLPQYAVNGTARAADIEVKREGWIYGPSIAGNTSYYPNGTLGNAATAADHKAAFDFQNEHLSGGVKTLDDFSKYYDGQWKLTAPDGPYKGMLTNYTDDLLFSMERLSVAPFRLFRVQADDSLPFAVDNAAKVSGLSLSDLQSQGRLFLVDHSDQKDLPRSSTYKYGGAAQAYFYIHPDSDDFLPLAIKPNNEGSDLVFTPEDDANDWLLAKMIFNLNDVWYTQWFHLAATHEVAEIVYLSAIRSLSEEHPFMPILHRLSKWTWAMRPLAIERLVYSGGPVDQLFPWAGSIAQDYTDGLYQSGEASAWQANYFSTNLAARGLINSKFGPALKSFPFHDDASTVLGAIRTFFAGVVDAYYEDDDAVSADVELQAWLVEASGPAAVRDFPAALSDDGDKKAQVVDILTHFAYLVAVQHGVLNTNSPVASTASLPLHPLAFYQPLPTARGTIASADDLVAYLPPAAAAVGQIALLASFNRPEFLGTDQTLRHMFDFDTDVRARLSDGAGKAADAFADAMGDFADVVGARGFDADGLSQGMPFVWTALDPDIASYWITI